MFTLLGFLRGLISLVNSLTEFAHARELISAGEAKGLQSQLLVSIRILEKARGIQNEISGLSDEQLMDRMRKYSTGSRPGPQG